MLALTRIVLTPVIMSLTRSDRVPHALGIAAALFAFATATDFLDGYLARRMKSESTLGAFLDTTADKILVTGSLLALISIDRVSIWPASIIIFREFAVMALRGVVATRGRLVRPSTWGKIKAVTQYAAIFLAFVRLAERWGPWFLDQWAMAVAVAATIGSAWGYMAGFWSVVRSEPTETKV